MLGLCKRHTSIKLLLSSLPKQSCNMTKEGMSFSQQDLYIWSQDKALTCAGDLKSRPGSSVSGEVIKSWYSELNDNRTSHNNRDYSLCSYAPHTLLVPKNISLFNPLHQLGLSVLLTTARYLASHLEERSGICIHCGDAGDRGCEGWEDTGPAVAFAIWHPPLVT